ncbi:MAG TPA: hypothetical protein V6D23_18750 [Candidatus Obscuribacterales bacterium]
MSSAITFKENQVWGTNGAIEEILIKLIKYSPDNSSLLQWSLEHYRESFPGICCDLTEILTDDEAIAHWQATIEQALKALQDSGGWTDYGKSWIAENFETLVDIAESKQVT